MVLEEEDIYFVKRVVCPKCGRQHRLSMKTNLSLQGFVLNVNCVSCSAQMTISDSSVFRNTLAGQQEPAEPLTTLEGSIFDIPGVDDSPADVREGQPSAADVSSFFNDLE